MRGFRSVGGAPPFIARAEGAWLFDADGNRYIDYFGSWGPMILGHAFPPVVEAIERAARNSASYGASTAAEADLASHLWRAHPSSSHPCRVVVFDRHGERRDNVPDA